MVTSGHVGGRAHGQLPLTGNNRSLATVLDSQVARLHTHADQWTGRHLQIQEKVVSTSYSKGLHFRVLLMTFARGEVEEGLPRVSSVCPQVPNQGFLPFSPKVHNCVLGRGR